jgi:hypothetical protein
MCRWQNAKKFPMIPTSAWMDRPRCAGGRYIKTNPRKSLMIAYSQFILDFPAFANTSVYPETQFTFAASIAPLFLTPVWGQPGPVGQPTQYDFGFELLVAHLMTLWGSAALPAASGGFAGTTTGLVSSKAVGQVSLSYDVAVATLEDGGTYNLTTYGIQWLQMARLLGAGPTQVGPTGCIPPNSGPAWIGPNPYPGWFGS